MSELLELVTVANTQRMLGGVTYQTVCNYVAKGALEERWAFNRRLITRESIERYLARREETHHGEVEEIEA